MLSPRWLGTLPLFFFAAVSLTRGDDPAADLLLEARECIDAHDYAEADEEIYRDEVRLTYLHELGHYLGWDEDEIAERGLE